MAEGRARTWISHLESLCCSPSGTRIHWPLRKRRISPSSDVACHGFSSSRGPNTMSRSYVSRMRAVTARGSDARWSVRKRMMERVQQAHDIATVRSCDTR